MPAAPEDAAILEAFVARTVGRSIMVAASGPEGDATATGVDGTNEPAAEASEVDASDDNEHQTGTRAEQDTSNAKHSDVR